MNRGWFSLAQPAAKRGEASQRGKLCKKRYHAANAIRLIAQPRQKRKVDLAGGILASRARHRANQHEDSRRGSRVMSACCHVPSIFRLFLISLFPILLLPYALPSLPFRPVPQTKVNISRKPVARDATSFRANRLP